MRFCKKFEVKLSQLLSTEEFDHAKRRIVGMKQRRAFTKEIDALLKCEGIPRNSNLKHLNPWREKQLL